MNRIVTKEPQKRVEVAPKPGKIVDDGEKTEEEREKKQSRSSYERLADRNLVI